MATDDLRESVRHLPDQLRDIAVAAADLDQLPDAEGIESVVVLGTGGARVAGDVIEAICELRATVPIVATGARLPSSYRRRATTKVSPLRPRLRWTRLMRSSSSRLVVRSELPQRRGVSPSCRSIPTPDLPPGSALPSFRSSCCMNGLVSCRA